MKSSIRLSAVYAALIFAGFIVSGCHANGVTTKKAEAKPTAPAPLDLTKGNPDELGVIPILEYHELGSRAKAGPYEFPLSGFRRDMERLYKLGYRPVSLHDYVSGHMNVPAGKTPVVITFDDALRGQVDFDAQGNLDPNCAAGILVEMSKLHKDWTACGTFFVLPIKGSEEFFYQKNFSKQKLEWLINNGFEVGNHTRHHLPGIQHWPDSRVMAEFADGAALINKYIPGYAVDTLALPFGKYPKNLATVVQGTSGGVTYHNVCALLAGAGPAPSPASIKFKQYKIPRMIPGTRLMTIGWWLDYLEKHKDQKYISDGDPNTITVHEADKAKVNIARVKKNGLFFRTYVPGKPAVSTKAAKAPK
ncbi:MAG TPA: polysaccharide deacetylase family protein [Capsulimonadaceae bacterium]|jgi:hypothetical protein